MSSGIKSSKSSSPSATFVAIARNSLAVMNEASNDVVYEGWLLKKKKKKMQGYARRYFYLRANGTLSYSLQPGQPIRDQLLLHNAALSSSPSNRYIHVDTERGTFHMRGMTQVAYESWMTALRRFIMMPRAFADADGTVRRSFNYNARTLSFSVGHAVKMNAILSEMSETIGTLDRVAHIMYEEELRRVASLKEKRSQGKDSSAKDGGLFGIFHRHSKPNSVVLTPPNSEQELHEKQEISHETPAGATTKPPTLDTVLSELIVLREQHRQLAACFQALLHLDGAIRPLSPLSATAEEEAEESLNQTNQPSPSVSQVFEHHRSPTRASRLSRRTSIGTMDTSVEWFDAVDGPEEFIIPPEPKDTEDLVVETADDSDSEGEATGDVFDSGFETSAGEQKKMDVQRRTNLPAPTIENEMSLLSVLKKNIGKDLATTSLPVSFNEPISILQRLAEDLEYSSLLDRATAASDPVERVSLIAAFAISGYACTRIRAGRKPFNPMLGETFEDIRNNFIAEKVSHVPPVMACHASGQGWTYDAVTQAKQRFWGRSLEIIPLGPTSVQIGDELYTWDKPSSFMRNLVAGTKYLEHVGTLSVKGSNRYRCDIEFKEAGMWGSPNIVTASVFNPKGRVETRLEGKWHEQVSRVISKNQLEVLWRASELPPQAGDYYGFTYWGITLNELSDDLRQEGEENGWLIPPTDSRWRPDQRAMEEGDLERAESEKVRVEEEQRERRKADEEVKPRWFEKVGNGDTDWAYCGGYWKAREEGFVDIPRLW